MCDFVDIFHQTRLCTLQPCSVPKRCLAAPSAHFKGTRLAHFRVQCAQGMSAEVCPSEVGFRTKLA